MKSEPDAIQNSKFKTQRVDWEFRISNFDFVIALALAFASFLLYLRTLAPDVVDADGGEFQFGAWNFSFVHPTGYPLYLILGGAFQHLLPVGNPAYRLNLFTALTGALALAAVYLAAKKLAGQGAGVLAAASFGLSRTFWFDASAAETYDFNAFFIALLVYFALVWQSEPSARKFAAFCFVFGLALANHRTIVLWIPAFLAFFAIEGWCMRSQLSGPRLLPGVVLFLLPLLLYLYVPLRAPSSAYATLTLAPGHDLILYDNSLTGLVNYLMGRVFQSELAWDALSIARILTVPQLLVDQFGAVGIAFGIAGVAAMIWRKEWARLVLLGIGFISTILFASFYHIGDIFHYYIPACLVWAWCVGAGVSGIIQLANRRPWFVGGRAMAFSGLLLAGFLLLPFQFVSNFSSADRSGETRERAQWTRILAQPIPQNAILISNDRDEMMPLWYIQYVENTRRDVVGLFPLITPGPQTADIANLTDLALASQRPVFFIKPMPGIETRYVVEKSDILWRVVCNCPARPQYASDAKLAGALRLIGYDLSQSAGTLDATLYWQPLTRLDGNYTTFAQLIDSQHNKIAQGIDHQVGGDYYPTSFWRIGETLRDEQTITLPSTLSPGSYSLVAGMYHYPDMEMLGEPISLTVELR